MNNIEKPQVLPIFPTPIYFNSFSPKTLNHYLPKLDQEILKGEKEGNNENQYGKRSANSYLLNDPEYNHLAKEIMNHVYFYVEDVLLFNYKEYKFSQSWVSVKTPGQPHSPHTHPHSLISGVIFYGDVSSNTSGLTFHRGPYYSNFLHSHPRKSNLNQFVGDEFSIDFQPNSIVLFPSDLIHSVDQNNTGIARKSIAFNIVPKKGLGKEDNLTQLSF